VIDINGTLYSLVDVANLKEERDRYKVALEKYVNVILPGGMCPANDALRDSTERQKSNG